MIKLKYGEFEVLKFRQVNRKNDRVKIEINNTNEKFKGDIENFIKDLGKFETYMNGIYFLLNPALKTLKPQYDLIHKDIDIKEVTWIKGGRFIIFVEAKTDDITNYGKELDAEYVEGMIGNIEKYYSLKNTLKLFKEEILKGGE